MSEKLKKNYLKDAWLILLLAVLFGGALAGVQKTLQPKIDRNKEAETFGMVPKLVSGAVEASKEIIGGQLAYKGLDANGNLAGWVIPAGGQGFADRIELLVGLDAKAKTITGLYVLDQKETPGLGNKITFEEWRSQFAGKPAGGITVTKTEPDDSEIQAVTGATISSESVVSILNNNVAAFRKALSEEMNHAE